MTATALAPQSTTAPLPSNQAPRSVPRYYIEAKCGGRSRGVPISTLPDAISTAAQWHVLGWRKIRITLGATHRTVHYRYGDYPIAKMPAARLRLYEALLRDEWAAEHPIAGEAAGVLRELVHDER